MKITAVKSFALRATHRNIFIVKVETDAGVHGLGEAGTSSREKALEGMVDHYARVDVCNVGGLTEARKVAGWCKAHHIDMMPHNPLGPICAAATAHLCTAINNFTAQEQQHNLTYPRDLFPAQLELQRNHLLVPDTPGLGVDFNEEAAADYPFQYWECPHWHRRDGAYTNW